MDLFATLPPAPPPDTSRLSGTTVYENDASVLAVLQAAWKLPRDALISCEVGVRNLQDEVYRRAAVKGVTQMLYLDDHMTALGFAPELEESEHYGSGFDIIYRYVGDAKRRRR